MADAVRGPAGCSAWFSGMPCSSSEKGTLETLLVKEGYVMVENLFPGELSSAPESQSGVGTIKETSNPSRFSKTTVSAEYQKLDSIALVM